MVNKQCRRFRISGNDDSSLFSRKIQKNRQFEIRKQRQKKQAKQLAVFEDDE